MTPPSSRVQVDGGGVKGLNPAVLVDNPSSCNFCPRGVGATLIVVRLRDFCSCLRNNNNVADNVIITFNNVAE